MTVIGHNFHQPIPKREQKIIIFDSPDGTGKTEIAYALSKELKVPYFRMATQHENWRKGKFKEALEFDQTYLSEFLRQTRTDVVIDRAYPAEWVYSHVYKRKTNMDVLTQVDAAFARMGAYIVIPLRHDYSKNRKDEVVTDDKLKPLHDKYLEFCEWTRCSTIVIYVDAFGNDLKRQLPLLVGELDFGGQMGMSFGITLDRPMKEKDVSDIFKSEPLGSRKVSFKKGGSL